MKFQSYYIGLTLVGIVLLNNFGTVLAAEWRYRPETNITVVQGETAVLPCSIQYLGNHQVAWTGADGLVLTYSEKRVVDNVRLSVDRPYVRDWNLHIRETQYSDRGKYHCLVNTSPIKQKDILLIVLVPPLIIRELSSPSKTIVQEGNTVTLTCNATGVPQPEITWYRLGSAPMQGRESIGSVGETLKIHNASRHCSGTYVCEAANGIKPRAFRNMVIDVHYSPEVYLPVARMGQYLKKETYLQCEVTAHPHGLMYWAKGDYIFNTENVTSKYTVEMYQSDYNEKNILSLRIREITHEDYGKYTCFAKNFIGEDKESMILYDYSTTTSAPDYILSTRETPVTYSPDNNVPPLIIRELSSDPKTIVREGNTVTLTCNATGVPQPDVTWYRLGSAPMQRRERIGSVGETLKIHNVSRDFGGTYVCEAANGNMPKALHTIVIDVHYSPEINLPVARMGQYLKKEAFLQCEVTAHPHGLMHWAKGDYIINTGDVTGKYTVEMYQSDFSEKNILILRIREITHEDYGKYTCFAKNFIGKDKGSMLLYVEPSATPMTNITLSEADISSIANVLSSSFESKFEANLESLVKKIVYGVLDGFRKDMDALRRENEELKAKLIKLEIAADSSEQYSRRNRLRVPVFLRKPKTPTK